jgi:hypothetical protein
MALPPRSDLPVLPEGGARSARETAAHPATAWLLRAVERREDLARTALGRKLRKFARDPDAFFTDSRYTLVRDLGTPRC